MAFEPKDWRDLPDITTPITANALEDIETRLSDYTDEKYTDSINYTGAREIFILNEAFEADDALRSELQGYTDSAVSGAGFATESFVTDRDDGILARWTPLVARVGAIFPGAAIQTTHMLTSLFAQLPSASSQYVAAYVFHYNPADYAVTGYDHIIRLKTSVFNNETVLVPNLTFGVAPVTVFNSVASGYGVTLGSNVSGTAAQHSAGLGAEASSVQSVEFEDTALSAGFYALTIVASAAVTGTTTIMTNAELLGRNVPS